MKFSAPQKRKTFESVIPMINVVFLLLIFFLLTARIAPQHVVDVTLPTSETGEKSAQDLTLYMDQAGEIYFQTFIGAEAEAAYATSLCAGDTCGSGTLRADKDTAAVNVARLLTQLAQRGVQQVEVVTAQ
ncbi:hypothetical protein BVC71_12415 [Marivivens niveibacter]|uniref:Biopolymer transporter ExbD n=1 Tax=Marivivens niveibacter TaxID=1930667 RepID=A0A251WWK4_9RHOB|nr:biopolymer transporter ExbD [Marivivens niveibacter]OUD08726.1 hypothetical protein BVC71_12415 [Marivivens niveibacter]